MATAAGFLAGFAVASILCRGINGARRSLRRRVECALGHALEHLEGEL